MHFLEKKSEKLVIGKTNKNDIFELLGPPSTKGYFDKELWIYMEIQTSSSKLSKLGKKKLLKMSYQEIYLKSSIKFLFDY